MKQFNLEEYLKNPNKKVVTRDGRSVRIICTDRVSKQGYPLLALVMTDGNECVCTYNTYGEFYTSNTNHALDLFFAPEKHEGWVNIYKHNDGHYEGDGNIYNTEEECKANQTSCYRYQYLTTIKIEWEE